MKKVFVIGFLALSVLMTGCGEDSKNQPATENKTKVVKEEKPVELTAEEKARQDEARKAAEEKRKKDAEEREARLQAENAQRQARLDSLLNEGVQFDYKVEKIGESKYKIIGNTNLPDGMQIMLTLNNRGVVEMGAYTGQDKPVVKGGVFVSVFSGKNLVAGEYELSISSPDNDLQSQSIQSILGQKGENLFGLGVIEDKDGKRISFEERIYLP